MEEFASMDILTVDCCGDKDKQQLHLQRAYKLVCMVLLSGRQQKETIWSMEYNKHCSEWYDEITKLLML